MDNSFKIQLRDSFESEMDAEADVIHSEYDSVCFSQVYPVIFFLPHGLAVHFS